jgi:Mycothiol maleylpyruvate isomerase N-terminal domain
VTDLPGFHAQDSGGSRESEVDLDAFDLGAHYRGSRERLTSLVLELIAESGDMKAIPVPACPSWSVHDVLAHLTAVVEDVMAGRIKGPPSSEETSAQVERRREVPTAEMLEEWTEIAPGFETALQSVRVWPGFLDVLSHEHDIRGAVDRPAGRDEIDVIASAEWLLSFWNPPVPLVVRTGRIERVLGDSGGDSFAGVDLTLSTTPFEVFRFRLGRRSPAQLRAMSWTGDPAPVLDHMVIFGPEPYDVVE